MNAIRFKSAISAIAVATVLSGCAIGPHPQSHFGGKIADSKIGLATRAAAALEAKEYSTAVSLAEQAVEATPNDAGFRMILGNCYFGAGRLASAEAAYRDSLSLLPDQPKVILKLALVQIAEGKTGAALGYLELARSSLDPADYGLAIALAGRPADAVAVLQQAARNPGADARVRQNLALSYGLAGDWQQAKVIAAQDVAPDQVDGRIHQWMQIATPAHAYDQVAALTGVKPVADPGRPQRLALKGIENPLERYAQAAAQQVQQTATVVLPEPKPVAAQPEPLPVAAPAPMPTAAEEPVAAPEAAPEAPLPDEVIAEAAKSLVASAAADPIAPLPTKFDAPQPASYVAISDVVRKAAAKTRPTGNANAVVQIGAYGSPQRVAAAWNDLSRRYPSLNHYRPVSARFEGPKGTVYRLAVKGFASAGDAQDLCSTLRGKGKNCFVRRVAGDAPVQFASR